MSDRDKLRELGFEGPFRFADVMETPGNSVGVKDANGIWAHVQFFSELTDPGEQSATARLAKRRAKFVTHLFNRAWSFPQNADCCCVDEGSVREPDWRERFPVGQRVRRVADYDGPDSFFGLIGCFGVVWRHEPARPCIRVQGASEHQRCAFVGRRSDAVCFEPVAFIPGDLVSHPEHGEGLVYESAFGEENLLYICWTKGGINPSLDRVADELTLIRKAPWSEVQP